MSDHAHRVRVLRSHSQGREALGKVARGRHARITDKHWTRNHSSGEVGAPRHVGGRVGALVVPVAVLNVAAREVGQIDIRVFELLPELLKVAAAAFDLPSHALELFVALVQAELEPEHVDLSQVKIARDPVAHNQPQRGVSIR